MTDKIIKVGTFFSGIGSPEKALEQLKQEGFINDYNLEFFSEIDKDAIKSYCAIHNVDESLNLGSILDIKGENLPYCDLWIGGFPCQDISCAGKMRGFDFASSTRSSLGWEMIRLLKEVKQKPKYIIFENVAMITSKKFKNTLNLFKEDLIKLGYTLYDKILNAVDYGIPQSRKRYFLVAILDKNHKFEFPKPKLNDLIFQDYLDDQVDEKYFLTGKELKKIDNILSFKKKNTDDIRYEVDMSKYKIGGVCGKDNYSKYHQSARIFSPLKYAPTLTANNTADNIKIVVKGE